MTVLSPGDTRRSALLVAPLWPRNLTHRATLGWMPSCRPPSSPTQPGRLHRRDPGRQGDSYRGIRARGSRLEEAESPRHSDITWHRRARQFTALSLMMLHQDGRLDYDDPVGKHLPEVARFGDSAHHPAGAPPHLRHSRLLRRFDGLQAAARLESDANQRRRLALLHRWESAETGRQGVRLQQRRLRPARHPGRACLGQSLDGFLQQRVFGPTGMSRLFFDAQRHPLCRTATRARGYDKIGNKFTANDRDPLDNLVGSGSVYCSVEDLARYDAALYTDQLVRQDRLSPDAFEPRPPGGWQVGGLRASPGASPTATATTTRGIQGAGRATSPTFSAAGANTSRSTSCKTGPTSSREDVVMKVFDLYLPAPSGAAAGSGPN